MPDISDLITDNLDIWSSTVKKKKAVGRGSGKKIELYGVKKLRELILDLAVRGMIVPQVEKDGSSLILLKAINEVKQRLLASKKIKKAKVVKTQDMPGVFFQEPCGWALPKLEELIVDSANNIVDGPFGSRLRASEYVDSGVPIIRIQNIDRSRFKNNGLQYLPIQKAEELERHSFLGGDIVLNKLGEPAGKACMVPDSLGSGIIVADIIRIRIDQDYHDKQYLIHCLNSPVVARQFSSLAKGVTRQRVNLSQVRSLKIPLPPKSEQHRIVAKVDELMALCDQLEQQQEDSISAHQTLVKTLLDALVDSASNSQNIEGKTKFEQAWERIAEHFDTLFTTEDSIDQLKQTILQLAVMGKLVPQDPKDEPSIKLVEQLEVDQSEWLHGNLESNPECKTMLRKLAKLGKPVTPFQIPKSWACCHLIQISRLLVDCHNKTAPYVESGIPIIRTTNIRDREFNLKGVKFVTQETYDYWSRRCPPMPGDIMFTREAPMGEAAIIPTGVKWCLGQRTMLIKPLHEYIDAKYLLLALTEPGLLERASEHAIGSTVKHLRVGDVENLSIPLPPKNEQIRIVEKLEELIEICDLLKSNLALSQSTQLLISNAIAQHAMN